MEKHFKFNGGQLTIREAWLSGELGTTIWDAASVTLAYIEAEKDSLVGKRIVELGSGTGIVGIGAAVLGGIVTITDMEPMMDLMQLNVEENKLTAQQCAVKELTWGNDSSHLGGPFEVILMSDVVRLALRLPFPSLPSPHFCHGLQITHSYVDCFPGLVKNLVELSTPETRIIMAFERRLNSQDGKFFELMGPHFTWTQVPGVSRYDPYYKNADRMFIFEMRKKPAE